MILKDKTLWRWKNTVIDFSRFDDNNYEREDLHYKINQVMYRLPLPFNNEVHEWNNGEYSSEYNEALRYAFDLGLIEQVYYLKQFDIYVDEEAYYAYTEFFYNEARKNEALEVIKKNIELDEDYSEQKSGSTKAYKLTIPNCVTVQEDENYSDECYPNKDFEKIEEWLDNDFE